MPNYQYKYQRESIKAETKPKAEEKPCQKKKKHLM